MSIFLRLACLNLAGLLTAFGATLTVTPSSLSIGVGQALSVDVVASGLTDNSPPALGAFQLDFAFDDTILSFGNVVFGSQLSLNGTASLQGFIPGVGSAVSIFESSFNTTAELDDGQLGTFLLFRINFVGLAPGASGLNLVNLILADSNIVPNDITSTFTVDPSSVMVTSESTVVPEPGTFALFFICGALLLNRGRKLSS